MADRIEDNADLAVEDLRRKARRRLVGAVVLALAAAILLPLLLEKEPRPLGDEVSIQIPPVDSGKFVSRLSPEKAKDSGAGSKSAKADDAQAKAPAAEPSVVAANPGTGTATASAPPASTTDDKAAQPIASAAPAAIAPPPSAAAASSGSAASASVATHPSQAAASAPAPATLPTSTPEPAAPKEAADASETADLAAATALRKPPGYVIQLAAFTDDKGAASFANKIRKEGYPVYTEPGQTAQGKVWRVRVGGYPSRAAAHEVLAKLKAAGHDGLVAAAK